MISRRSRYTPSFFLCLFAGVAVLYADATVTRGSGPDFPLEADSAFLFVWRDSAGISDSSITALPASIYAELRNNIDSVYNYATALRLKRKELSGCATGRKYGSCLSFTTMGTVTLKVLFSCGDYRSGKVITATDRYPFVVKLTKGFSEKLRKLARKK
jgi:hypothetical protein